MEFILAFISILAAILEYQMSPVEVNETAGLTGFCLVIKSPVNDCPLAFPFAIYLSTISATAGMYDTSCRLLCHNW